VAVQHISSGTSQHISSGTSQPASLPTAYLINGHILATTGQILLKFSILARVIKPELTISLNEDHLKWKKTSKYSNWNISETSFRSYSDFKLWF
jgi:hypothetical protein